ncbi:MAG: hypothetical protein ACI8RZ_001004 [Myxococcota bacterium]|jgi:hypothetical protein
MDGTIEGGWLYVLPVYIVTWTVLAGYGISLILRGRQS